MTTIQMVTRAIFKTKAQFSGSCQKSEGEGNCKLHNQPHALSYIPSSSSCPSDDKEHKDAQHLMRVYPTS